MSKSAITPLYSRDHLWVREYCDATKPFLHRDDKSNMTCVRIGLTAFLLETLGTVTYVKLPSIGARVLRDEPCCFAEAAKAVSDIYAPVTGVVTNINSAVSNDVAALTEACWLIELGEVAVSELDMLMDETAYAAFQSGRQG